MIQEIITYAIIATASGVLLFRILQFFNLTKTKRDKCGSCSTGCAAKELHVYKKVRFNKKDPYRIYL
jgi:hypothetical protein